MKVAKKPTKNNIIRDLTKQLNALADEAKKVNKAIDTINKDANKNMDDISAKVDKAARNIERLCSNLDRAELEAENELDKLMLRQAEDLANG